ncbi:MAG: hypothetical protein QY326_06725 [Bdellovibrionota bacterium]|nr:MAG: hypothetical protein QY326_06725 [Bdellovibrionota bacterium]
MIKEKALPLEISSDRELRIRVDSLDQSLLRSTLATMVKQFEERWGAILEERCSYLIGQEFTNMLAHLRENRTTSDTSEPQK